MKRCRLSLISPVVVVTVALSAALLTGCGGGSGGGTKGLTSAPTSTTRSRVKSMAQLGMRSLTLSGVQSAAFASRRNGVYSSGTVAPTASGGVASSGQSTVALPMVGAFLKNVASAPPAMRAARLRSRAVHIGRDVVSPIAPGEPYPQPTFYYDDYLGLWVQINDSATSSSYLLYQDEAKTEPAGSIDTTWPADWDTYPQVYASTYNFTAGFLAGSHGSYTDTTNADGSGSSSYEDTYTDGSHDKGSSTWNADGSSSWTSRSDNADGSWYECSGTFLSDGSGKTHEKTSDGYGSDDIYNADGSGSSVITGPDPGLPAKIVWDIYGNETITYADGTVETIPGWTGYVDGGTGSSGDGGDSGSGSTGSGGTVSGSTAPPPSPVPTAIPL